MKLYLIRHGETDWNREDRIQGWIDVGLNEVGRRQVEAVSSDLPDEPVDLFYSSLRRARESADRVREHLTCRTHRSVDRFRELDQGHWDGLRGGWLDEQDDERYRRWIESPRETKPPDGESLMEVRDRVRAGLLEVLEEATGPSVIVAHKVVNNIIRHLVGGCTFGEVLESLQDNAQVDSLTVRRDHIAD